MATCRLRCAGGALLVLTLCGCSDDDGGASQEAVARFFESSAAAYCDFLFRCCQADEVETLSGKRFSDHESCVQVRRLDQQATTLAFQLAATRADLTLDTDAADRCLTAWEERGCPEAVFDDADPAACSYHEIFVGKRAAGEPCGSSYACAEGLSCQPSIATVEDVCAPQREQGAVCTTDDQCQAGLVCSLPTEATARSCQPLAQQGEPCELVPCDPRDDRLLCDVYADPTQPVCAKRKALDEPCEHDEQCQSRRCAEQCVAPAQPICSGGS